MDRLESSKDYKIRLNTGSLPGKPVQGRCGQGSELNTSSGQHQQRKIVLLKTRRLKNYTWIKKARHF